MPSTKRSRGKPDDAVCHVIPTSHDIELADNVVFFPSCEAHQRKLKVKSYRGYSARLTRRILKRWYSRDQIVECERESSDDFGLSYLTTDLGCPFLLEAAKLKFIDALVLLDERKFFNSDVWRAYREECAYGMQLRLGIVFPVTHLGDYVIYESTGLHTQPQTQCITRWRKDLSSLLIISPLDGFMDRLSSIWTPC